MPVEGAGESQGNYFIPEDKQGSKKAQAPVDYLTGSIQSINLDKDFSNNDLEKIFSQKLEMDPAQITALKPELQKDLEEQQKATLPHQDAIDAHIQTVVDELVAGSQKIDVSTLEKITQALVERYGETPEKVAVDATETAEKVTKVASTGIYVGTKLAEELQKRIPSALPVIDDFAQSASGSAVSWAALGAGSVVCLRRNEKINQQGQQIENLMKKIEAEIMSPEPDQTRLTQLNKQLGELNASILALKEAQSEAIQDMTQKGLAAVGSMFDLAQSDLVALTGAQILHTSAHALGHGIALAAAPLSIATSLLSLGVDAVQAIQENDQLSRLKTNMSALSETISKTTDPDLRAILEAKLDAMEAQKNEMTRSLVMKAVRGGIALLGTALSIKAILVLAGVSFSTAATVAFQTMGISLAVAGATVGAVAISMALYKARHELQLVYRAWDIPFQKLYSGQQLAAAIKLRRKVNEQMENALVNLHKTTAYVDAARDLLASEVQHSEAQRTLIAARVREIELEHEAALSELEGLEDLYKTVRKCTEQAEGLEKKMAQLEARKKEAMALYKTAKFASRFHRYDAQKLEKVREKIDTIIADDGKRAALTQAMQLGGMKITGKITPADVLDFIVEDKQVKKNVLAL